MFSKAEVKRFNDTSGCAPPVGLYDPKDGKKATNVVMDKSDRFKHPKDSSSGIDSESVMSPASSFLKSSTPIKGKTRNANWSSGSESSLLGTSGRSTAKKPQFNEHLARIKELELEIRRLVREKSEKDKELQRLRQGHERLEGRLSSANSERAAGLARCAQLEQEARDAKRGLDVLQKQVTTAETAGKRKEEKLREEVQCLQQQIESKEQEIQTTQKQIVQALLALAADTEDCVRHSHGLGDLLCRLEISTDMTENDEDTKQSTSDDSGCKQIDAQIKKVHRMIKRVSSSISKLAESGTNRLDVWQSQQQEQHCNQLNKIMSQLGEAQVQHQQLQQQLTQQQQQHEQHLAQLMELRQDECESMQQKMEELQKVSEAAQQCLTQTQQDYASAQTRLQQTVEKHEEVQAQMQKDREALELQLEALEAEAYAERATGTPVRARQLLFEEAAEKAELLERLQQLEEEKKVLKANTESLTANYEHVTHQLELDLKEEKEKSSEMERKCGVCEKELQHVTEELEKAQLASQDLLHTVETFKDEVSSLKSLNEDTKKEVTGLQAVNTELQATMKDLHLQLEEEQERGESALHHANSQLEQLQVENKQHAIANQALQDQVTQLTQDYMQQVAQLNEKCQNLTQEKQRLSERHKEDLQSVRKALALDRQANEVQLGELNLKLERAQAFNTQMKEELKKLLRDKEKLKDDSRTEISALQVKVQTAEIQATEASSQVDLLRHQLKHAKDDIAKLKETVSQLEQQLASQQEEEQRTQSQLQDCQSQLTQLEEKYVDLEAEKQAVEDYLSTLTVDRSEMEVEMEKQVRSVQDAALEERTQYERMISEMSEKIQELEEQQRPSDNEEWKEKYEELFARVEPFLEQLDAFAAERNLLLGRSQMAEQEVGKLMDKYAKLLGHQNQRQKIHYINKLKEEYMQCRKEKESLKEKCNKQQNSIQKLEKKIQALEGRKTFDPLQAFKHGLKKEDDPKPSVKVEDPVQICKQMTKDDVTRSPLKQSNK